MKRAPGYVALLAVIVLSMSVLGCGGGGGGGGGQPAANAGGQEAPPAPPTPDAGPQVETVEETRQAVAFAPNADTPKFFRDLVELGTPLVVLFYSTDDPVHEDVMAEVSTVEKRYSNQAEFVKIKMDDSYEMASLPKSRQTKAEDVTNLAEQLGARFTPHLVIIDRNSMITFSHAGYIDAKTLEQELFKALKR